MTERYGSNSAQVEAYLRLIPSIYSIARHSMLETSSDVPWQELSESAFAELERSAREQAWLAAEDAINRFIAGENNVTTGGGIADAFHWGPVGHALRYGALALVVRDLIPAPKFEALTAPLRRAAADSRLKDLHAIL